MSSQIIARSPDLQRLRDEGYDIDVHASNHLLLHNVPYVTATKAVAYGTIVAKLDLAGDRTIQPDDHVVDFVGVIPCDHTGAPLSSVVTSSDQRDLGQGLIVNHRFSSKPESKHLDYYEKMTAYVTTLSKYATRIDPEATAINHCVRDSPEDGVFEYRDTASTRVEISALNDRLALSKVGIIGLGGTGSYVLDLVSKTPVKQIHLYDGDRFEQHNAFRSPGAATQAELQQTPPAPKVEYYKTRYSAMHRAIVPHFCFVDESNVKDLADADFVFVCVDKPQAKRPIVEGLIANGVPFIEVGMGIYRGDRILGGMVRTTLSTGAYRVHRNPISFVETNDDEYATNIQVADLNALNAALAVIKWKKTLGFYADSSLEHNSFYVIESNEFINEDLRPGANDA